MNITDQASGPTMEQILSSLRTVASNNEKDSHPVIVATGRETTAAPQPAPKLQPEPEPQPMAKPQGDPEPQLVKEVATSEEADKSGPEDHFDLTEAIQTIQKNSQFRRLMARTDRKIVEGVISAWKDLRAVRKRIGSDRTQVDAANLSLKGVRQEDRAGSRTPLDVLDAEKKYLDAQVALNRSRRDEVLASYELLASVGRITAEFLRLPVGSHDLTSHYAHNRGKGIRSGLDSDKSD